ANAQRAGWLIVTLPPFFTICHKASNIMKAGTRNCSIPRAHQSGHKAKMPNRVPENDSDKRDACIRSTYVADYSERPGRSSAVKYASSYMSVTRSSVNLSAASKHAIAIDLKASRFVAHQEIAAASSGTLAS